MFNFFCNKYLKINGLLLVYVVFILYICLTFWLYAERGTSMAYS